MSNKQRAGVLAGNRNADGSFNTRGISASFWSSSESGRGVWVRSLNYSLASDIRYTSETSYAFSTIYEAKE